jgi:Dyp-type peroxidase family
VSRRLSDLFDVQGIVRGYGVGKFPVGLFFLVGFGDEKKGRRLIETLLEGVSTSGVNLMPDDVSSNAESSEPEIDTCELKIADALDWTDTPPDLRLNIAFTAAGLAALKVPWAVLDSFPKEFKIGMRRRKSVNGDTGGNAPQHWDGIWQDDRVHAWVGLYACDADHLEVAARTLGAEITNSGCKILEEQPVNHLSDPARPGSKGLEHFGFADGISNPPVDGVSRDGRYAGGRIDKSGQWQAMAAGEFVIGMYQDEIAERPKAPASDLLVTNGSFMVYRKLHQDVDGFRDYIARESARLEIDPEYLGAKMVGRFRDGTPLARCGVTGRKPRHGAKAGPRSNDFLYSSDPQGEVCPLGSHIRRTNPRDSFGFGTKLVNRHRMLRRGIPYGEYVPEGSNAREVNGPQGQGLIFIALMASIERQFEFVQQQWVNFGDSLFQSSDRDPIAGNNGKLQEQGRDQRDENGDEARNKQRYGQFRFWNDRENRLNICTSIPRFVTTKGGNYFFLPGVRALSYLSSGRYVRVSEVTPDKKGTIA